MDKYDENEPFESYLERVAQFFIANDIDENDKKKAVFTFIMGKNAYGVLRDLCSPAVPHTKTFNQLCEILKGYYKPQKLEAAESCHFHEIEQETGESISSYCARLNFF